LALFAGLFGPIDAARSVSLPPRLDFWNRLSAPVRAYLADDIKLLIGWTFDAAASHARFAAAQIVDGQSTFVSVPGFAPPTPLRALRGRYRIERVFDEGRVYYGIEFAALDESGTVVAVLLLNRLFRMPIALHEPLGVLTDVVTNGAMVTGFETPALGDARSAAETASADAGALGVPLVTGGQSQAGGMAQLQAAYLQRQYPGGAAGFITLNAAHALASVRRLGFAGEDVAGINFSKDLDPGFGPKAFFANRVGFQVYIHRDGRGGTRPGETTIWDAVLQPRQHFLESFNDVSLTAALEAALAESAAH
jgi:hypothetical protein